MQVRKLAAGAPSAFNETTLKRMAKDFVDGRMGPAQRLNLSDDMVTGLRATILKSGKITLQASYFVGERRPTMYIGEIDSKSEDDISIADARELTKIIKALGDKGIDPQDGLIKRLRKELMEKGTRWRP